jgi:hypothetical protein
MVERIAEESCSPHVVRQQRERLSLRETEREREREREREVGDRIYPSKTDSLSGLLPTTSLCPLLAHSALRLSINLFTRLAPS